MKILHISLYPKKNSKHSNEGFSGVVFYTKDLVTNTKYSPKDKVYILCDKLNNHKEEYREDGFRILRYLDKNRKFSFQVLRNLFKINPNIIHLQFEFFIYGGMINALLAVFLTSIYSRIFNRSSKFVITIHQVVNPDMIDKTFVRNNNSNLPVNIIKIAFRLAYKLLGIFADTLVVHEEYFKNVLVNCYGVKENKVEVVPLGVENSNLIYKKDARFKLNIPQDKNIILFMGYLAGYKGVELLIDGFAEYVKNNPNSYLIIGAGPHPKLKDNENYIKEYDRLVNKAKELIPAENYNWSGFIDEKELQLYFSATDVFISPYTVFMASSGPLSLAIGYGVPFVCSDVFNEFVKNKELLFERNPESLSNTLSLFFENKDRFTQYAKSLKSELLLEQVYKKYMNTIYVNEIYENIFDESVSINKIRISTKLNTKLN